MKSCFYQYRKGLYEVLSILEYDVHRHVPKDAGYPYIYIGDMSAVPFDDAMIYSQEVTVEIHVVNSFFGDQGSDNKVDEIMDEITQLLISKGRTTAERDAAIEMDDFQMTPNQLSTMNQEVTFDDVSKEIRNILTMVAVIDQKLDVS